VAPGPGYPSSAVVFSTVRGLAVTHSAVVPPCDAIDVTNRLTSSVCVWLGGGFLGGSLTSINQSYKKAVYCRIWKYLVSRADGNY